MADWPDLAAESDPAGRRFPEPMVPEPMVLKPIAPQPIAACSGLGAGWNMNIE